MPTKNTPDNKSQIDVTLDIVNQLLDSYEFTPPIDSIPKHGDIKAVFYFNYKDTVTLVEERNKTFIGRRSRRPEGMGLESPPYGSRLETN